MKKGIDFNDLPEFKNIFGRVIQMVINFFSLALFGIEKVGIKMKAEEMFNLGFLDWDFYSIEEIERIIEIFSDSFFELVAIFNSDLTKDISPENISLHDFYFVNGLLLISADEDQRKVLHFITRMKLVLTEDEGVKIFANKIGFPKSYTYWIKERDNLKKQLK